MQQLMLSTLSVASTVPRLADFPKLLELHTDAAWSFTRGLCFIPVGKWICQSQSEIVFIIISVRVLHWQYKIVC